MSDDAPLWIDTDAEGRIVNWSRDAFSLTGYSERAVVGHSLPLMLAKDRPVNGHSIERDSVIRPKDRRGIRVRYPVELGPSSTDAFPRLRWTFVRI
jgi:PAS domain S-box-containing protein